MAMQAAAMEAMTRVFRHFEQALGSPDRIPHKVGFVFRYRTAGIHEALIQKLARSISGLNAAIVLIEEGYFQETGVIFRTLDEILEDIVFLASALTDAAYTDKHDRYLKAFYLHAVTSQPDGCFDIPQPNSVGRKDIRNHSIGVLGNGINQSEARSAGKSVSAAYSGYVHAASENIMEMFGGDPPQFHLTGMLGTLRETEWKRSLPTYIYRGLLAANFVAKGFGDHETVATLYKFSEDYAAENNLL